MAEDPKNKVCLVVIDGWGVAPESEAKGDAVRAAATPAMDAFATSETGYTTLAAHGLAVGLPDGLMGNSEVGHLNIGAGRVVYQDIVRIDLSLQNKTLASQPNLAASLSRAASSSGTGRLHLAGLVSDGGVHSHQNHLHAILDAAKAAGVPETYIHFFGDGRDTSPRSAVTYLERLKAKVDEISYGTLATIVGRYYAMDRDKRWERVKLAYDALTLGKGVTQCTSFDSFVDAVKACYVRDETDEFLKPIVLEGAKGTINDGDTVLFFNYRSDRMRELSSALGIQPMPFEAEKVPKDLSITTMTQYKADFPFANIFPPQKMDNVLAEWLGKLRVPQCHIAETEKYAHVTFFFNGGTEAQYVLEERELVASPKVATYDLKPEMSAIEVAEKVAERIGTNQFPFIMCNFAPPDMVGHTGIYEAAVRGVEATDKGIGIIARACEENGYILFVTADHGNAEKMIATAADGVETPHTAHTCNPVPFVMTGEKYKFLKGAVGCLADVAPTVLDVMGLSIPPEMDGKSLIS
ncbi:metalloenzyme [Chytriomyces sp. MP71]|nr:metalloenzyme [Chytriomyces sp. MP71]